jgi:hypothetical protein
MNTTQDIINKIAKLKDAIEGETDPDVKSRFASKIAALEADLNKAEEIVEVKIEKQQVAEQKDLTEAEKKIAKLKDALSGETDPDVKARFEKKIKELQGDLGEVKQEIKEEKKEIAKQKKEIKQAVKEVRSVKKVVRKEAVKKVVKKVAERKKVVEVVKPKRKTRLKTIMSDLDALIRNNKKLAAKYRGKTGLPAGQKVDLKRDAKRSAKPFGWRFTGKYDYRDPKKVLTERQFSNAKKKGLLDYEARPNRSDVYPAGYKGNKKLVKGKKPAGGVRKALADGGMMDDGGMMKKGGKTKESTFKYHKVPNENLWAIQECDLDGKNCGIIRTKKSEMEAKKEVERLNKQGYCEYSYADGGMMKKGGVTRDAARFAKPKGWRWKNDAVGNVELTPGHPLKKSALSKPPSKKARRNHPDDVAFENRGTKSDKKPYRRYKSL